MTIKMLQLVMKQGDNHGSALRNLLKFYHIEDNDLSPITDDMVHTCSNGRNASAGRRDIGF